MPESNPARGAALDAESQRRWFAGKDLDVLIFRVNRRSNDTLFEQPPNFFQHFLDILSFPVEAETGRQHKRIWHIGNKIHIPTENALSGILGWIRSGESVTPYWNEDTQTWDEQILPNDATAAAPFTLIGDGRYLGVLRHPSFTETNVADAFKQILNKGEDHRNPPTTSWDVEPVGDIQDFLQWVQDVDSVVSVEYVFKRPNPDAERDFEELFQRLDYLEAKQFREEIVARVPENGLNKEALTNDTISRSFISAAMAAFGYIVARGLLERRKVKYDQRLRVARERLVNIGESWEGATENVLRATRQASRRRTNGRTET